MSSIAAENEITVLKPRTSGRQRHTANAAAETIEEHFRINILYPFTDHVISHLNTRFPEEVKPMLFIFYLLPRYLYKLNDDLLETILEECKNDIPFPDHFPQEVHQWRNTCNVRNNCVPESCTLETTLSYASDFCPNIHQSYYAIIVKFVSRFMLLWTFMHFIDDIFKIMRYLMLHIHKVTQWGK